MTVTGQRHKGKWDFISAFAVGLLLTVPSTSSALYPAIATIDLNRAGALEGLQMSHPKHYDTIKKIIDGLTQRPYEGVVQWVEASFRAKQVRYSENMLTSFPPQRDLRFQLDDLYYRARVTLTTGGAKVLPR